VRRDGSIAPEMSRRPAPEGRRSAPKHRYRTATREPGQGGPQARRLPCNAAAGGRPCHRRAALPGLGRPAAGSAHRLCPGEGRPTAFSQKALSRITRPCARGRTEPPGPRFRAPKTQAPAHARSARSSHLLRCRRAGVSRATARVEIRALPTCALANRRSDRPGGYGGRACLREEAAARLAAGLRGRALGWAMSFITQPGLGESPTPIDRSARQARAPQEAIR
jgi:hypothetical protein